MKRLVCTATAFGYGPVSKLLTVCKLLAQHRLEFVGTGVALELARHAQCFSGIYEADPASREGQAVLRDLLAGADLLVNVLEPTALDAAWECRIPCCYIDSLFWMWAGLPSECNDVACYVVQRFPGVSEKQKHFGHQVANLRPVGPIVDRAYLGKESREDLLLINLSGLESPFARVSDGLLYPEPVVAALVEALRGTPWSNVVVAGNRAVMAQLEQRYGRPGLAFRHLSHEDFLRLLARSRMLLSSPGLTATYEALVYRTPIRFLPPQNYSQALMLGLHRQSGLADLSLGWNDLYADAAIPPDLPEDEGVRRVLRSIQRFGEDADGQRTAQAIFRNMLSFSLPDSDCQLSRLGEELTDGAAEVRTIIEHLLWGGTDRG